MSSTQSTTLQTLYYPGEMEARLNKLRLTAETAIEETGANILYLVLGFLEWYESKSSDAKRLAPLFLIPVQIEKSKLNKKTHTYDFTLSYTGETVLPNLSFMEKMRLEFGFDLPELEDDQSPEDYFAMLSPILTTKDPRWTIHRHTTLGLANFSKLLMYLDLSPDRWPEDAALSENELISKVIEGNMGEVHESTLSFEKEYAIDDLPNVHDNYPIIQDCDSSQHSALVDALKGKNMIIEGPPGTGKSQTITNIICAAMAQGKKVLFVAEKLAALEVVKRRLDEHMLGDFCLELHSHNTQKGRVLNDLKQRLQKKGSYRYVSEIRDEIKRYESLKEKLKHYAEQINTVYKQTGLTFHDIFIGAGAFENRINENVLPIDLMPESGQQYTAEKLAQVKDRAEIYVKAFNKTKAHLPPEKTLEQHPFYSFTSTTIQPYEQEEIKTLLKDIAQRVKNVQALSYHIEDALKTGFPEDRLAISERLEELRGLPAPDPQLDLSSLQGLTLERARFLLNLLQKFSEHQKNYHTLKKGFKKSDQIFEQMNDYQTGIKFLEAVFTPQTPAAHLQTYGQHTEDLIQRTHTLAEEFKAMAAAITGSPQAFSLAQIEQTLSLINTLKDLPLPLHKKRLASRLHEDHTTEVVEALEQDIAQIHRETAELSEWFDLSQVPEDDALTHAEQLVAQAEKTGLFSWAKADWRKAKQTFVKLSKTNAAFKDSVTELKALESYLQKRADLSGSAKYAEHFGDLFEGFGTDFTAIAQIQAWIEKAQQNYGVGFGPRVHLGQALLSVDYDIIRGVFSFSERAYDAELLEIKGQIEDFLSHLQPAFKEKHAPQDWSKTQDIQQFSKEVEKYVNLSLPVVETGKNETLERATQRRKDYEAFHEAQQGLDLSALEQWLSTALDLEQPIAQAPDIQQRQAALLFAETLSATASGKMALEHLIFKAAERSYEDFVEQISMMSVQHTQLFQCENSLFSRLQMAQNDWQYKNKTLTDTLTKVEEWIANVYTLEEWSQYCYQREKMHELGIKKAVVCCEKQSITPDEFIDAVHCGVYNALVREILTHYPDLARFSGTEQSMVQKQFQNCDKALIRLQSEHIAWKLDQNEIPAGTRGKKVKDYTEGSLLHHECEKSKRHIPIRRLIERAGQAILSLKPCFMMGPMSVAQYLKPGYFEFDLVIMDEASQIKPEDALGAIARAKQLIVVGDSKQLPPTNFFNKNFDEDIDEDERTTLEESESILDAVSAMFTSRRLRWHYRSQHQSLIAFSNQSYYNNDLVVFPSPHNESPDYGIQYTRVDQGTFINNTNEAEAYEVVNLLREQLIHHPKETVGVVAMNTKQQELIETLIDKQVKEDPAFQKVIERQEGHLEKLFVKNLENVQGDERDVILISMTYGPKEVGGRVYQRFGPINSELGWRRLNVLLTRSRKRMSVVSSMGSEDILVKPDSKKGVTDLRNFLKYCETGILHDTVVHTGKTFDSEFEVSLAEALSQRGYKCLPQVGVAGFYIDLAVIDPNNPARFLLGIECDGATYHSSKSARDRDRLRQEVLERLGWDIHRIWSTDWFKDPRKQILQVVKTLEAIQS